MKLKDIRDKLRESISKREPPQSRCPIYLTREEYDELREDLIFCYNAPFDPAKGLTKVMGFEIIIVEDNNDIFEYLPLKPK